MVSDALAEEFMVLPFEQNRIREYIDKLHTQPEKALPIETFEILQRANRMRLLVLIT
jgi:hypothetical protein